MKRIITAVIASLALFAFAPMEADAGNGKKKNKNKRVQTNKHSGHNHSQNYGKQNYGKQNYGGNNYKSHGSVRFFGAAPLVRSYARPVQQNYGYGYGRPTYYRPTPRFPGPSLFFGGGGGYCH